MQQAHRFIVVTGKGGVGKTTLALAIFLKLKNEGKKVCFATFEESETFRSQALVADNWFNLELLESARGYVAKKIGSTTVADWVCSSRFFKALLEMLPGFSYVIYLGRLMEKLHADPELFIVLDSPSSGHALTLFEACWNFKKVFGPGLLGDDLIKILNFLYQENLLQVIIATLPGELPLTEGIEVKEQLANLNITNTLLVVNYCLSRVWGIEQIQDLPTSLKLKIKLEQASLSHYSQHKMLFLPYVPSSDSLDVPPALANVLGDITEEQNT